jgi:hypothetical protein
MRFRKTRKSVFQVEMLEGRIALSGGPDVGDTITKALDTGLVDSGTYILDSQSIVSRFNGSTNVSRLNGSNYQDVDMFSFHAQGGQTVTVTTALPTGGNAMVTYLRLFDDVGNELAFEDKSGGNPYSQLTFTAPRDGTYYIGVSGVPNEHYDPNVKNSYSLAADFIPESAGDYSLSVQFQ